MPLFYVWLHQLIFVIIPPLMGVVFRLFMGGALFVSIFLLFKLTVLPAVESISASMLTNIGAIQGLGNSVYEVIQILEVYKLTSALISCMMACFWIKLSSLVNRAYASLKGVK